MQMRRPPSPRKTFGRRSLLSVQLLCRGLLLCRARTAGIWFRRWPRPVPSAAARLDRRVVSRQFRVHISRNRRYNWRVGRNEAGSWSLRRRWSAAFSAYGGRDHFGKDGSMAEYNSLVRSFRDAAFRCNAAARDGAARSNRPHSPETGSLSRAGKFCPVNQNEPLEAAARRGSPGLALGEPKTATDELERIGAADGTRWPSSGTSSGVPHRSDLTRFRSAGILSTAHEGECTGPRASKIA